MLLFQMLGFRTTALIPFYSSLASTFVPPDTSVLVSGFVQGGPDASAISEYFTFRRAGFILS